MIKRDDAIDVVASVVEVQSKTMFDRVSDYLTEQDWSFSSYADNGYLTFGLRLRDGNARVLVDVTEGTGWNRLLVYTTYPTFVPQHRRPAVAEAISRINYEVAPVFRTP
jgi:hypothetical protein